MREKPRDEGRLRHILHAIDNINRFMSQNSVDDLVEESPLYFAVIKNLEIIGEAAYMLTKEFRSSHSSTPWKQIIGMRHCLVHGYYQISIKETLDTIKDDLPILKIQIEEYLKEF